MLSRFLKSTLFLSDELFNPCALTFNLAKALSEVESQLDDTYEWERDKEGEGGAVGRNTRRNNIYKAPIKLYYESGNIMNARTWDERQIDMRRGAMKTTMRPDHTWAPDVGVRNQETQ